MRVISALSTYLFMDYLLLSCSLRDERAKHDERRLLEVGVVPLDALLSLSIDLLRNRIGLVATLLTLRDLADALLDDLGRRDSYVLPVVSEG